MTIPKTIADKIAELEALVAEKQTEINRYSQTIGSLQERVQAECQQQDAVQDKLDLLRFVIQAYAEEPVEIERVSMQRFVGDVEVVGEAENWNAADENRDPTPAPQPESTAPIKDRVLTAMSWRHGPVTASAIARELGISDTRQVGPIFGQLSREKKIKPAASGGWVRTGGLVLALLLGGAGAAQAQYVPAPNIYAPSNWPMLRMEQQMQQQQQTQPYQFGVGMPGGIYGGGRSCVFIPGTGEVCR